MNAVAPHASTGIDANAAAHPSTTSGSGLPSSTTPGPSAAYTPRRRLAAGKTGAPYPNGTIACGPHPFA
ncbi:hypothetical protein ACFO3J_27200 [Streptomyces polygonati]|uniref:Uncharacterized protein n=1 Tax=Streptomyces polygonati TaxID=1617087 RepID=A0ABV8HZ52_9ACTN